MLIAAYLRKHLMKPSGRIGPVLILTILYTCLSTWSWHELQLLSSAGGVLSSDEPAQNLPPSNSGAKKLVSTTTDQNGLFHFDREALLPFERKVVKKYDKQNEREVSVVGKFGLGPILEMLDPMGGRRGFCLWVYYSTWRSETPSPSSFEQFFHWLDHGPGSQVGRYKNVDAKDPNISVCLKKRLNVDQQRYYLFTPAELEASRVEAFAVSKFDSGGNLGQIALSMSSPIFVASSGTYVHAWSTDGSLYMSEPHENRLAVVGHASFFRGKPLLHAGEIGVDEKSRITFVSNKSGHYQPETKHLKAFVCWLAESVGSRCRGDIDWDGIIQDFEIHADQFPKIFDLTIWEEEDSDLSKKNSTSLSSAKFLPKVMPVTVSCGGHRALSCKECGEIEPYCHGECIWDTLRNECGSGARSTV